MPSLLLSGKPTKTRRVIDRIEADIRAGVLPPGGRMLPRSQLCTLFGVSSAVIDSAYDELEANGLIIRSARSGVTVSPNLKHADSMTLGVITGYGRRDIEDYFEPLLAMSEERRVVPMIGYVGRGSEWWRSIGDLMARSPDAVLVDVEARHFDLDELQDKLAPIPVCFVNRWQWVPDRPERAVLVDYAAAWAEAAKTLWLRGNDRILLVAGHRHPFPHALREIEAAKAAVQQAGDAIQLAITSVEDMETLPETVKQLVADFKPMAVFGYCDYALIMLEHLCPETAALDRIGIFDTHHSRHRGHEFSSFRIDFEDIWKKAIESFKGSPKVERIPPTLIKRWRKRHELTGPARVG